MKFLLFTTLNQMHEVSGIPPESYTSRPGINPIENAFSKFKACLRKAAARTIPELWDAIRYALPKFTIEECANYFTATGSEPE